MQAQNRKANQRQTQKIMKKQQAICNKQRPKTYTQLLQKVGSDGKYQKNIFLIFTLVFFIGGCVQLGNSFLFLNNQYECQIQGLLVQNCKKVVCQIQDVQERNKYFVRNKQDVDSIGTQYGPFLCEDEYILDILTSCPYFGSLIGYILFVIFTDNFGRKSTMTVSLSTATIGCILISTSFNLPMVAVGVILVGGGIGISSSMVLMFLAQAVGDLKRQKYSVIVQSVYNVGVIIITCLYYFLHNWRLVLTIIFTVPMILLLIIFLLYVQQTPQFLLKNQNQKTLKALNRIGNINFKIKDMLCQQDIQNVRKEQQKHVKQFAETSKVSPLDLCRYKSLRNILIISCLTNYMIFTLFYGSALIIDQIGFNTYVTSLVGQSSQLIGYIPTFYFIDKVNRKKACAILFLITSVSSFTIFSFPKPQNCQLCYQSIIQVGAIFVFRFGISSLLTFFNIYAIQLFPSKIVGMGSGATYIFGTTASTLTPIILGVLSRLQFSLMLFFFICGIIGISLSFLLKQTLGIPIKTQIEQIQLKKQNLIQYEQQIRDQLIVQNKNLEEQVLI